VSDKAIFSGYHPAIQDKVVPAVFFATAVVVMIAAACKALATVSKADKRQHKRGATHGSCDP
jgi:hypothetical protein